MSSLNTVRDELSFLYHKADNTIERFNILNEVEELIKELRQSTIDNMDQLEKKKEDKDSVVLSSKEAEVLERIQRLVCDVTGSHYGLVHREVVPHASINELYSELALDSLDLVELVMAIEDEFETEITDEQAESFKTVKEVIDFVI